MRVLRLLGPLAIVAAVAFPGATSAAASTFTSTNVGKALSTSTITNHVFEITGSTVKCTTTKFEGESEGTGSAGMYDSETQKVHPVYEGCTAFGLTATVTTASCNYKFNANTGGSEMGSLTIEGCATEAGGEKGLLVKANSIFGICEVLVPNQTVSNAVSYENNGGTIKIKATATAIKTNVVKSTGVCPLTAGLHEGAAGGNYTGETEVAVKEGFVQVAALVAKPKFGVYDNPAGLNWAVNEVKRVKVEDEGAAGENWTLRSVGILQLGGNWELTEAGNCLNKAVAGGSGFSCEVKVKCKMAGQGAWVLVFWTNGAGRKSESWHGEITC